MNIAVGTHAEKDLPECALSVERVPALRHPFGQKGCEFFLPRCPLDIPPIRIIQHLFLRRRHIERLSPLLIEHIGYPSSVSNRISLMMLRSCGVCSGSSAKHSSSPMMS